MTEIQELYGLNNETNNRLQQTGTLAESLLNNVTQIQKN